MRVVIAKIRTEKHSLESQVSIGSKSGCLFKQLERILNISDSVAGLKVQKSGGGTRKSEMTSMICTSLRQ